MEKYMALFLHFPKRFYGVKLKTKNRNNMYLYVHTKCVKNFLVSICNTVDWRF